MATIRNKYIYTQEEIDYLKSIIKGRYSKEIIELYTQKFNKDMTYQQLMMFEKKYNIRGGLVRTQLKTNPKPSQSIGYEMICKDKSRKSGKRIKVKVGNKKWVEKSRYIYEQHYGKIPKDCVIIFLDGNEDNYDIDNLKCITNYQNLIMMGNNLYFNDKKLNETSITVAKLIEKTKEIQNEK